MDVTQYFKHINEDDDKFRGNEPGDFKLPEYHPKTHYRDVAESKYFYALVVLRHYIKQSSDIYWARLQGAYNIDLFMMTPSVSSPMGPGSDSEAINIKFGGLESYLVDSSQFGFEPVLINNLASVYCYLPSMRGENSDNRHLNQFFHCEVEVQDQIDALYPKIEGYVKFLADTLLAMPNILNLISENPKKTKEYLSELSSSNMLESITLDEAIRILHENGYRKYVKETDFGRDLSNEAEIALADILNTKIPIWIKGYDRDRVPFYQKPDPENPDKVINADLIFPPLLEGSFGGEIVGCGQRQDNADEMLQSIKRQGLDAEPYQWYIDLRNMSSYKKTSGFGLGIERFIAWALGKDNIRDVILYPRLKGIVTYP